MAGSDLLTLDDSDYSTIDGQQTVIYTQVKSTGNQAATVDNAVGLGPERHEVQVDGGFIYLVEQIWYLPVANMGGLVPAEGDYLTDASGVNWWLQSDIERTSPAIAGSGAVYRVVTRQQRGTP